MTGDAKDLPAWAEQVRRTYLGAEASMFLLHLNVFDRIAHGDELYTLTEFLARVLLAGNKDNIVVYDPASGVRFLKGTDAISHFDDLPTRKRPAEVLPALESLLMSADSTALIVPYVGVLTPAGTPALLSEQDRINIITMHRWSLARQLAARDNVIFLITESLPEVSPQLVANPMVSAVEVPLPDADVRAAVIRRADPSIGDGEVERLARHTAGLRAVQVESVLTPRPTEGLDDKERLAFIESLLGDSPDAADRARKLSQLTADMGPDEIRHLINPGGAPDGSPGDASESRTDPFAEVIELVHQRKRQIIEKECHGLIEFLEPRHDLSAVGGNEGIKVELRAIAERVKAGDINRVPMGLLFVGPMGSGKTFVANAFIKESGITAVRLKNFRSKWVGATEANLEKVLNMVRSLGPIVLVIDEGDRAFGGATGESDGGTSSRVIARLKEFMSDPQNRGRVLFILMTNRPDKLDVDIKRAGRLDRKIPFFYPDREPEVEAILGALMRRYGIERTFEWDAERERTSSRLVGYSSADLEAVVLLANDNADVQVSADVLAAAIDDYLPPRDSEMLEYMELLAVFETSRRSLLPERFKDIDTADLQTRLRTLRALRNF